jgi:NADPH-dependent 2,4-dienoyl-CoA reductase/sulfur reductase-like enzyme
MTVQNLVVVGASLAGLRAVEAARKSGYQGRITLIGAEDYLPYNRPPLSKGFLDADETPDVPEHRSKEAIDELDVDLLLGRSASELDTVAKRVAAAGEWLAYDALVVATGATPRTLPGAERLNGVHTLRTVEDAAAVRGALDRKARTVVIGAGFIGSEVAAAARKRGLTVTLVEALPTPLTHAVGEVGGAAISRLHRANGADLRCGVSVTGVSGGDRVEQVHLSDGSTLEADLVIVGIGAAPDTGWLESSSLTLDDGVVCDSTLFTGAPGVYAAGDVARWHCSLFDRSLRVEHWTAAAEQGALAARNALDPDSAQDYDGVPYFWSDCYDSKIQFAGIADAEEINVVSGDIEDRKFTVFYRDGDRLVGALTMNNPAHSAKSQGLIAKRARWHEALERIGSAASPS